MLTETVFHARYSHVRPSRFRSACRRLRRLMVEFLEQRTPLSINPIVAAPPAPQVAQPAPQVASLPGASSSNGSQMAPLAAADPMASTDAKPTAAPFNADPSAGGNSSSAAGNQQGGVIALLFDPHQPKSGVPADVTFSGGPPLQQGAPPRFSYNLEDNITGAGQLGPRALEVGAHGTDISGTFANNIHAYVASTSHGVPNFGFGPDTWVFGPQEGPPGRRMPQNRPAGGQEGNESGELPVEEGPRQRGAEEESNRSSGAERRVTPPLEFSPISHSQDDAAAESRDLPPARRQPIASAPDSLRQLAVRQAFSDESFLSELAFAAATRSDAASGPDGADAASNEWALANRAAHAERVDTAQNERPELFASAASAACLFAPSAVKQDQRRRQSTDLRGWSLPTERPNAEPTRGPRRRFRGNRSLRE